MKQHDKETKYYIILFIWNIHKRQIYKIRKWISDYKGLEVRIVIENGHQGYRNVPNCIMLVSTPLKIKKKKKKKINSQLKMFNWNIQYLNIQHIKWVNCIIKIKLQKNYTPTKLIKNR